MLFSSLYIHNLEEITMTEYSRLKPTRANANWLADSNLAFSADAYIRCLAERGYATRTIQMYLVSVAHFAHWCAAKRIGLIEINESAVQRFLYRHLPMCHCSQHCQRARHITAAALGHLLDLLRVENRIAPKKSPYPATISDEIHRFNHYLTQVCGLKPATCHDRLLHIRSFLLDQFATGSIRMNKLKPAEVIRFINKYTQRWTASSKRHACNSLRSYFRFKALNGEHTANLSAAIPIVAQWRLAQLPKGITVDETARLLKAFDFNSPTGKRDYAITRCFVDLGLRASEVAALTLDDIDWRQGHMHIRGKGRRVDVMPLPNTTGRAIIAYLRHGRSQTGSRALFLRHRPPLTMPATPGIVRAAVRYAAKRCGVERCLHGPQVLRHSLAERLVQCATPLKQIADLLRHRSLNTTTIYAKVNVPALSRVAMPWPGRQS
jgi:integrase/recombinase XerD